MTEAEWDTCDDGLAMLRFLRGRSGKRKMRLLACACARFLWHGLVEDEFRRAVEIAEKCADGQTDIRDLRAASSEIFDISFGQIPRGEAS